eukprot:scpid25445/ scgid12033/ 
MVSLASLPALSTASQFSATATPPASSAASARPFNATAASMGTAAAAAATQHHNYSMGVSSTVNVRQPQEEHHLQQQPQGQQHQNRQHLAPDVVPEPEQSAGMIGQADIPRG